MNDKLLVEALEIFAQEYNAELGNQLRKLNKNASGKLLQSLDYIIKKTGFGTLYTIQLLAEDYLQWVDAGRRPGSYPPVNAISQWVRLKGIPQTATFPIMKKIHDDGIKPTNVIQKSLDTIQRNRAFSDFEDNISDWVDERLEDFIFNISKNNNITVKAK